MIRVILLGIFALLIPFQLCFAQENIEFTADDVITQDTIFNDKLLLEGYINKYNQESLTTLFEMIKDEGLMSYKMAAAINVVRTQYGDELVSRDRKLMIQQLWRRLHRTDSPFVQVEAMLTLLKLDRYRYYNIVIPLLIQKLDHYNRIVNEYAFKGLNLAVRDANGGKAREARIVFNILRKMMFLSRNRLKNIVTPDQRLTYKLELLRWSIKVLGTQELKRLPKEVIGLL